MTQSAANSSTPVSVSGTATFDDFVDNISIIGFTDGVNLPANFAGTMNISTYDRFGCYDFAPLDYTGTLTLTGKFVSATQFEGTISGKLSYSSEGAFSCGSGTRVINSNITLTKQ
jgi:hypothetical protein